MRVQWLIPVAAGASAVTQVAHATQYLSVEQARREAFPQATQFIAGAAPGASVAAAVGAPAGWMPRVFDARNGDAHLGWLIVDQVIGKSELITYSLALDAQGAVLALEVLDYRESHGGEVHLAPWRRQFVGKTSHDAVTLNADIRNISGATLSCRHLTEGVQRLLRFYAVALRTKPG